MILIGLGANLPHPQFGSPEQTLLAALREMAVRDLEPVLVSRFFVSPPYPASLAGQPWYVNAVASIVTDMEPERVLAGLHEIEWRFGRVREERWAPRYIDLDLLAYDDRIMAGQEHGEPVLPHPRMHQRAFVLLPLTEVAPGWCHPENGRTAEQLLGDCDLTGIRPLDDSVVAGVSGVALGAISG